jgi:hypothetical protein
MAERLHARLDDAITEEPIHPLFNPLDRDGVPSWRAIRPDYDRIAFHTQDAVRSPGLGVVIVSPINPRRWSRAEGR